MAKLAGRLILCMCKRDNLAVKGLFLSHLCGCWDKIGGEACKVRWVCGNKRGLGVASTALSPTVGLHSTPKMGVGLTI